MKLNLLKFPHSVLKATAKPVEEFNDTQKELVDSMKHLVHSYGALGLAAPQVGFSVRIIVCKLDCGLIEMINPQVREVSTTKVTESGMGQAFEFVSIKEGCLSIPGVYQEIRRNRDIEVTWQDVDGEPHRAYFHGKDAIIIQHEVDHLDGVLFIDRLGALRSMVLQKYFKVNKR